MDYKTIATKLRLLALESVYSAQSGHIGGSLSICDILSVLFFKEMRVDSENPQNPNRDRFILSKGHAAPSYYAALALKGFFPKEDMKELRQAGAHLQGHPCMHKTSGVDMSTGSLGQGLSIANGMALAAKYGGKDYRVYCICGDGEAQEGQIWEAVMTAAHYKLDNLVMFLDNNGLQIDGEVSSVMNNQPFAEKFAAFDWNVVEIDGHNYEEIENALKAAKNCKGRPTAIVAHTVKGKGVSFMENGVRWHGSAPNTEQYERAKKELEAML